MPSRLRRACAIAAAALALAACAAPQPLSIRSVIEAENAPPASSISAMRTSRTTYALRGSDFGKLQARGVADPVLDYIQQSFIDDVDLLTRYWVLGESVGGCSRCVPVEVDLSDPDAPRERHTSTAIRFDRPQGMPSWYRPYSAKRGRIDVEQVRQMAASGRSEAEIVQAIRSANLEPVVGVGGLGTIRTRPVAAVSGSELAQLRREGVPDAALDELQSTFLAQFVEVERLRYQHLGKGSDSGFN